MQSPHFRSYQTVLCIRSQLFKAERDKCRGCQISIVLFQYSIISHQYSHKYHLHYFPKLLLFPNTNPHTFSQILPIHSQANRYSIHFRPFPQQQTLFDSSKPHILIIKGSILNQADILFSYKCLFYCQKLSNDGSYLFVDHKQRKYPLYKVMAPRMVLIVVLNHLRFCPRHSSFLQCYASKKYTQSFWKIISDQHNEIICLYLIELYWKYF